VFVGFRLLETSLLVLEISSLSTLSSDDHHGLALELGQWSGILAFAASTMMFVRVLAARSSTW
jgi:hypothetical protein